MKTNAFFKPFDVVHVTDDRGTDRVSVGQRFTVLVDHCDGYVTALDDSSRLHHLVRWRLARGAGPLGMAVEAAQP